MRVTREQSRPSTDLRLSGDFRRNIASGQEENGDLGPERSDAPSHGGALEVGQQHVEYPGRQGESERWGRAVVGGGSSLGGKDGEPRATEPYEGRERA